VPVFRTVKDARQGSVRLEAIHQPLYDSASITGAANISFFQNPAGRSALQTNVATAGQLSWPKRFSIRALRQVASPGLTLFTDMASYLKYSYYQVVVGEKTYLQIPAFLLTAGTGLEQQTIVPATATTTGTIYVNHGRPEQRDIYSLLHSIYIPPVQNFSVTLNIASGVSIATPFTIWLFLEGELLREIQ
jgi:hypothetical protein